MTIEKIIRFAQKSIYNTADVYEPGWNDDEPRYIGYL